MSEVAFLALLQTLMVLFPPFATLLSRYLPNDESEPLAARIRAMLPVESASSAAVRTLTERERLR